MNEKKEKKRFIFFMSLLICLCSFFVYVNSLEGEFVYDDSEVVLKNQDVIGTSSFKEIFSNNYWGEKMGTKWARNFSIGR